MRFLARQDAIWFACCRAKKLCGSLLFVTPIGNSYHSLRQVYKGLTRHGVGIQRRGRTLIAIFADALHQWNLRQ